MRHLAAPGAFFIGLGFEVSGYTNVYVAYACWVAGAILFLLFSAGPLLRGFRHRYTQREKLKALDRCIASGNMIVTAWLRPSEPDILDSRGMGDHGARAARLDKLHTQVDEWRRSSHEALIDMNESIAAARFYELRPPEANIADWVDLHVKKLKELRREVSEGTRSDNGSS